MIGVQRQPTNQSGYVNYNFNSRRQVSPQRLATIASPQQSQSYQKFNSNPLTYSVYATRDNNNIQHPTQSDPPIISIRPIEIVEKDEDETETNEPEESDRLIKIGMFLMLLFILSTITTHFTNYETLQDIKKLLYHQDQWMQINACSGVIGWIQLCTFMSSLSTMIVLIIVISEIINERKKLIMNWQMVYKYVFLICFSTICVTLIISFFDAWLSGCRCYYMAYLWIEFILIGCMVALVILVRKHVVKNSYIDI